LTAIYFEIKCAKIKTNIVNKKYLLIVFKVIPPDSEITKMTYTASVLVNFELEGVGV
jgi:hypothetical protein